METTRLCPQCQEPLAADAPSGLCPQCLLKAAASPPPSASGDGLPGEIIDIGDPAEVAKKLPQFEILEMLGRGGMGVVYKARQRNLDREVALKILPPGDATSPDFVARFSREARALAKLNHPNIVNVHDFGETGGLYYIVMEYVDGMNLRQLLQTRRLTAAEALAIVPKICEALQYAHDEGLVHRDIKPENLLIDQKGRVKIADFGLAKLLRREPLDMTLTLSGTALGTLRYMAPEQMDKPETVDHRADLYSLGVVIYEMLTGEIPVGRFELPSQKAQVDVRLDDIVLHALEKEPARRYQHASEIRTDVQSVANPSKTTARIAAAEVPTVSVPVRSETTQAVALQPLPRFFHLRAFVAFLCGWAAVAALLNEGPTGVVLGSVAMATIVLQIGRSYANRHPLWLERLHRQSLWKRIPTIFFNHLTLALVFLFLIGGLCMLWDTSERQEPGSVPLAEEFEAHYKGKEYQLLRQLSAFHDQVPTVELTKDYTDTFGSKSTHQIGRLYVIGGLLLLFFFFQQSAGDHPESAQAMRRGGWAAALVCTSLLLGSLIGSAMVLLFVRINHMAGQPMTTVNNTVVVQAKVTQSVSALYRWAAANGYESTTSLWGLQTVPQGQEIGKAGVFEAWKKSPTERWRITASGPERLYPNIRAEIYGSEDPAQTIVVITSGPGLSSMAGIGSPREKRWRDIVMNLSDGVSKATDFKPLNGDVPPNAALMQWRTVDGKKVENYILKPPVKTEQTGPIWPSLAGAVVAMLLWVFVTIRYLTPWPPSEVISQPAEI